MTSEPMLPTKTLTVIAILVSSVTACSLPSAGPTSAQIERSMDPALDAYLVNVTPKVVELMARSQEEGFPQSFRLESHRPAVILRSGDVVGVSIYESGGTPLFGGGGGQSSTTSGGGITQTSTLPAQIIEPDGQIVIPFAGRVTIAGRTPSQASDVIAQSLAPQTVKPQVIVSIVANNSNAVSVGGEVNRSGLVPLSLRGERLLDVIAQAGGPRLSAMETDVRVIRGTTVATIPLQQILVSPVDNIVVRPNDTVVLVKNAKTFVVMGAATKVSQYTMQTEKVTLAEGVAQAGGSIDTVGDLSAIYLFRTEPAALARSIVGNPASAVDASYVVSDEMRRFSGPRTRMVYRIDLTRTGGYFFAQNIALHDKDIVLIANAETTQLQKVFTLLRSITGMYFDLSRTGAIYVNQ